MKKWTLFISFIFCMNVVSFSQGSLFNILRKQLQLPSNIEIGGGVGASFANNELNIAISPNIGIHILPRLYVGIGAAYQYYTNLSVKSHMHVLGGNVLSRFLVIGGLYVQGEYEHLRYITDNTYYTLNRKFDNKLMLGVGYKQAISANMNAYFSVLWNFIQPANTTTTNPIIQAGIGYLF